MALGRLKHKSKQFVPPKLMLTSMMDMFTIILIFLIFSFSESPEHHQLNKALELPRSNTEVDYRKTVEITLTKNELRLNDEVMASVNKRQIDGLRDEDLMASTLYKRMKALREQKTETVGSKPQPAPHVLFLCDKSYSFKTINQVIKAAGMAGYPNFQFAVLEGK